MLMDQNCFQWSSAVRQHVDQENLVGQARCSELATRHSWHQREGVLVQLQDECDQLPGTCGAS